VRALFGGSGQLHNQARLVFNAGCRWYYYIMSYQRPLHVWFFGLGAFVPGLPIVALLPLNLISPLVYIVLLCFCLLRRSLPTVSFDPNRAQLRLRTLCRTRSYSGQIRQSWRWGSLGQLILDVEVDGRTQKVHLAALNRYGAGTVLYGSRHQYEKLREILRCIAAM
jgi:hypothetical protein